VGITRASCKAGLLHTVDADADVDTVFQRIEAVIATLTR
jgi:hypothetical protein